MILNTWVQHRRRNTWLTLSRSLLTLATPTAVLITVGHRQHSSTVIIEVMKDLENGGILADVHRAHHHGDQRQPGQRRHRLEQLDQRIDRGIDRFVETDQDAERNRDQRGQKKAGQHREQAGADLVDEGRLAGVGPDVDLRPRGLAGQGLRIADFLALDESAARAGAPAGVRSPGWWFAPTPGPGPETAPSEVSIMRGGVVPEKQEQQRCRSAATAGCGQISVTWAACGQQAPRIRLMLERVGLFMVFPFAILGKGLAMHASPVMSGWHACRYGFALPFRPILNCSR